MTMAAVQAMLDLGDEDLDADADTGDAVVDDTSDTEDDDADATGVADESSDGDTEGGSGDADDSKEPEASVIKPQGKALLELLAGDSDAQKLMASTMKDIMAENARTAASAAEAKEFQELIDAGDHAEIGRRILERTENAKVRESVADEVLEGVFRPVYAEIFSQPEFQTLTAEEKETLAPTKFASDAHYVQALSSFLTAKRTESAIEAEVERRIKVRDEATGNRKAADVAKTKGVGATPGSSAPGGQSTDSRSRIARGLKAALGTDDDDDDE